MSRSPRQSTALLRVALAALALIAVAPRPSAAQLERSTVSGTVDRSTRRRHPRRHRHGDQPADQPGRATVTDAIRLLQPAQLHPGQYDVSAELDGFKKANRADVQLDASANITIGFTLEPGALTEVGDRHLRRAALQTDVTLRKTVEAKDIEQLSFNGRNPIGVAGLKAGVIGGSFNNYGFSSLSNGGYNINGSRGDENNITVDGATAIRTRSAGAASASRTSTRIQEVQVLTANYMPEFGRASGGQIRMVTKSGSNATAAPPRTSCATTGCRPTPGAATAANAGIQNVGPAPFDYKQYGYSFGGPIPGDMFKDKLFFFGAQEWVNFLAVQNSVSPCRPRRCGRGDFSELLNPSNGFFSGARRSSDPQTGQPFPGNIIPAGPPVAERHGHPERLSAADAGLPPGLGQLDHLEPEPAGSAQGQHPPRLPAEREEPFHLPLLEVRLGGGRRLPRRLTFARTDWDRPNQTQTASWTSTIKNNLINEFSYTYSKDDVFINVFTEDGAYQRSKYRINYPYIFPENRRSRTRSRRCTSPASRRSTAARIHPPRSGPIHTVSNVTTMVSGRHTFKAGISIEYSGEDDFDQINVNATPGGTNNQNGLFDFLDSRAGAAPASASPMPRWGCSATTPSSASATSRSGARSRPTCSSRIPGSRATT